MLDFILADMDEHYTFYNELMTNLFLIKDFSFLFFLDGHD